MSRPTPRPLVPVVIVLFLWVAVVGPTAAIGASWADHGFATFAGFLEAISDIWAEEGCGYDPNGRCGERQIMPEDLGIRRVTANTGCEYDPNGRCRSGVAVDVEAGCGFDPNGRCQP